MCGITGIVDLRGRRAIDSDVLRAMNASLHHRGPDGDGFHFEEGVALGHRRLSIIDLDGGRQPLYNEDKSVVVTYNGEIYNFQTIEKELEQLGHVFRTRCDTEVIVHAWEQWGERCVERFNGMFAFAVWDRNSETLFLARDRLGVKPLYYSMTNDCVYFASELKALTVCPEIRRQIEPSAVEDYFAYGYVPDPKTIFSGVYKLEPGCLIVARRGSTELSPVRYWDVGLFEPEEMNVGAWQERLIEAFRRAVKMRLVADVPLGAFLSGGIDSSGVVAMMRDIGVDHLLTCSIGFKEARYDESKYAQLVADQKRADHKSEIVGASDYGLLGRLTEMYDEPFADSSALPTYRVCELARKHVTVALSGDGGDENFIGYRRYKLFGMEERLRKLFPPGLRKAVFGPLGRYYPKLDWAPRVLRGKTTFQALARCSSEGYRHAVSICPDDMRLELFSDAMRRELQGYGAHMVFDRHLADKRFEDPLRMAQYLDFKTYLPGDILTKVDRASMANSLEVRTPFLDFDFVEAVAAMPSSLKLRGGEAKYALKKALEPYLPNSVLYRRKMGFAVPVDLWFRQALSTRVADVVSGEAMLDSGFFVPGQLKKIYEDHQSGKRDHSAPLWSLLMFDGFLRSLDHRG